MHWPLVLLIDFRADKHRFFHRLEVAFKVSGSNQLFFIDLFKMLNLFLQFFKEARVNNSLTAATVGQIFEVVNFCDFFIVLLQNLINFILGLVDELILFALLQLLLLLPRLLVVEHFTF